MSYLSILLFWITSFLLLPSKSILLENEPIKHLTTTSSESSTQSDSLLRFISTLNQEFTLKNSIEINSDEEKVDSMLEEMHYQLSQKISSVEKNYEFLYQELLINADKNKEKEKWLDAKSSAVTLIFTIISLLLVVLFHILARGQPDYEIYKLLVSIFSITTIITIVITLIQLPGIIYFIEHIEQIKTNLILQ